MFFEYTEKKGCYPERNRREQYEQKKKLLQLKKILCDGGLGFLSYYYYGFKSNYNVMIYVPASVNMTLAKVYVPA